MKLNNEYDPFARIYNRYWGAEYRRRAFPVLRRLLLARLPAGAAALDLCCGTGQITAKVVKLGFAVSGVDASAEMLGFARRNAPGVPFHLADARSFSLPAQFDAAYSVFESLNHIRDMEGLAQVFGRVRRHLKPGSPFLFDLNGEEAFRLCWNTVDALTEPDAVCVMRMNYDETLRTGTCDFTSLERTEGRWERNDFTIQQTCHKTNDVLDALREAGFEDVVLYNASDAGMRGHAGFGRVFFLALTRPA